MKYAASVLPNAGRELRFQRKLRGFFDKVEPSG
jgi:hypothetical protein